MLKGCNKITVDAYSKPTNSFTYVDPKTCYSSRNINKIPECIALRLKRIRNSDEKYQKRSNEYQNYLIARNCSPSLVAKQFQKVSQISRDNARKPSSKVLGTGSDKFVTSYSPILSNINSLINKYLPILHADLDLKEIFPRKSIATVYRRQTNLKEMLAPSSYPKSVYSQVNIITPCDSYDICKHYLVAERKFTSKITGKTYFIKGDLSCNSKNVLYLITCDNCKDEYIVSAVDFKPRFRVHKSDMKTKNVHRGTSRHFNGKGLCSTSLFGCVKVQIIEQVYSEDPSNLEEVLSIEKDTGKVNYVTHGMNSINDLYSKKRKGYISKSLFQL